MASPRPAERYSGSTQTWVIWPTSGRTCEQRIRPISVRVRRWKTDEGCVGIEGAASGEAHDVVEKTQRPGEGAVLIVDLGIDVAAVGGGNQGGGGLVFLLGPGTNFELRRKRRQR